jgi:hypothetical protein
LRVVERAVRRETRRARTRRVEAADQHRLVRLHLGKIVPALVRIVGDRVGLAGAIGIAQFGGDKVLVSSVSASHSASGERSSGPAIGRQTLLMAKAVLQQFLGLVAHQVANALRRRPGGVVVVDPPGRHLDAAAFAGLGGVAHDMVERDDPPGPGRLPHQPLALGVVDRGDDRLVVEIGRRGLVAQQDEALAVERQRVVDRARVVDGDLVFNRICPLRTGTPGGRARNCRNRASPPWAP